jgi:hypothetical protein
MLVEVVIVSLSNDFPVLDCSIHTGNKEFLTAQAEVRSLQVNTYIQNIYDTGCVSQEGA